MKILLMLLVFSVSCFAEEPCGLRSMTDTTPLLYPPIARAAHVEGIVILMVAFKLNGEVQNIDVLSGHQLLRGSASAYVQGLRANQYGGPAPARSLSSMCSSLLIQSRTLSRKKTFST
jgi:hypothetical protein